MARRPPARSIDELVESMFRDVFTEEERAGLRERIAAWEVQNPDVSPSQRVTAWIDLAYEYQREHESPSRRRPRD